MRLNVLYGCDNNYATYTGVSMVSLLENNRDIDRIVIYFAAMNIENCNMSLYKKIAKEYDRELVVLDVKKAQELMELYNCNGWNGSIATWLRFFVLDQIPDEVEKILWLDSDTIIEHSLKELTELDMREFPVGAVCDSLNYYGRFGLGFREDEPYYNAGVILFNLEYWRRHSTLKYMMDHLQKHIKNYKLNDQDLLNDFFRGNIWRLPLKYNVQGFTLAYSVSDYFRVYPWKESAYYSPEQVRYALDSPYIVHFFRFLGDYPWQQGKNFHPCRKLYVNWRDKSPWKNDEGALKRTEFVFKVEKIFYHVLPRKYFLRLFSMVTRKL